MAATPVDRFTLREATFADIPFIMATERLDGYETLVGRWEADAHCVALSDPAYRYFVGELDGKPVGFAILRDWASPGRTTGVKRLAVTEPGKGHGKRMLDGVIAAVFAQTDAHRLWIGVFPENLRARRAYRTAGFVEEGIARGNAYIGDAFRDELILSILRPEHSRSRAGEGL